MNKLKFSVSDDGSRAVWSADGLPVSGYESGDFWRLFMDDNYEREMPVHSSEQKGKLVKTSDGFDVVYDGLVGETGRHFDVKFTVHIKTTEKELVFTSEIENHDTARVNEAQVPFIDFKYVCDKNRENDVLYRPNGLGERLENPWKKIEKYHTEYMSADYSEIWSSLVYPRPANMAWYGLESAGHFLYIARHNTDRLCAFNVGINPRKADPRLIFTIAHYPFAKQGETMDTAEVVVSLVKGDWRCGSDEYGAWARKNFYHPCKKPQWVHNFTGWQRIILRHQYGEVFWKYEDLPRLYQEGKQYGLDTLLVFGWWKGRFDNGYPVYEPDDALGGAEELKKAIAEVQSLGGRVILYTNGMLIDMVTDYYKKTGYRICTRDIDGNPYIDHYQFSNKGTVLRNFGYKCFAKACMSCPEWGDRLLYNGKVKLSFNPDAIFYDQVGGHHSWLCFDESHPHGNRYDEDPKYRREMFKKMRTQLYADKALGTETTVDLFASYIDYHHGCDAGNCITPTAFPQLFVRTFPEVIMTDRWMHDERESKGNTKNTSHFKAHLNNAFAMGYRFDVSIYRGRVIGVAGVPEHAAHLKMLLELKEKYHEFFYEGRYVLDDLPEVPDGVLFSEFVHNDKKLYVFANLSDKPLSFEAIGKKVTLEPYGVYCTL